MTTVLRGAFVALALALMAAPAQGFLGALDDVPGAFLLLPYFEVDAGDPNGPDTRFSVHNDSAAPIIADIGLFTDWGIETLRFSIFLGPHAVQEVRLRDVFTGRFPDGEGTAQCPTLGPIAPEEVAGAVTAHRGQASDLFAGLCAGQPFGDDLLRGYAIVLFPSFCGAGAAAPQGINFAGNRLWGDYQLIDRSLGYAVGETLPAVEGANLNMLSSSATTSGSPFSSEFLFLPSRWGISFNDGVPRETDVIVWRLPPTSESAKSCGASPTWFPLGQTELRAFDGDGNFVDLDSFRPFPLVANRVPVGTLSFPVPYDSGWVRIDLIPDFDQALNGGNGVIAPSYVAVLHMQEDAASLRRAVNFGPVTAE